MRYSLYFCPNSPPGKATSFPGNGMTTSNIEYLSTSSSVRVFTRGACHGFLLAFCPEARSSRVTGRRKTKKRFVMTTDLHPHRVACQLRHLRRPYRLRAQSVLPSRTPKPGPREPVSPRPKS